MMGRHKFATKLYYNLSLDGLVRRNHLLRLIANAVDFSFIYELARRYYSYTGQPSIDPVVLFKTLLIAYLYGVTSERRLMDEIQDNLAYRWFLGYDLDEQIPDHSVLSKARVRFGPDVFESFFNRTVKLCQAAGLVRGDAVFMDSTLFLANASMDALEPFDSPPIEPRQFIERVFSENPVAEEPEPGPATGASRYRKEARKPKTKQAPANRRERSRTDPEASIMRHPGIGTHLAYKAHVAVDDHPARVITAAVVTPGATADEHLLNELLWRHRRIVGRLPEDVVADRKYGTMENYSYLAQLGLHAVMPDRMGPKRHPGGVWSIADFKYDAEKDAYECAAGQWLPHVYTRPSDRTSSYIAPPNVCESCQFRSQCSPSGKPRTLRRHMDRVYLEAAAQWLESEQGRWRFKQRKVYIETTFAWAKDLHGLRRAQWRGRWKVQIQVWLTAAAMNLKKLAKATGVEPGIPKLSRVSLAATLGHRLALVVRHLFSHKDHFVNKPKECPT